MAFISNRSGSQELWVANSDGTAPRQMTALQRGFSDSARWSPDGNWIAFTSNKGSNRDIYLVPSGGGQARCIVEAVRLTYGGGWEGFESSDGQRFFYVRDLEWRGIWEVATTGGPERQILDAGWQSRWALADDAIYYQAYPRDELLRYDLKTRKITELGLLKVGRPNFGGGMSVQHDGSSVVWTQIDVDAVDLVGLRFPGSKRSSWF